MVTMNISLSEDLKERMDELNINWSSVARAAFEARLALVVPEDAEGLDRLRAERAAELEGDEDDYAAGLDDGKHFALDCASWKELAEACRALERGADRDLRTLRNMFPDDDEDSLFGSDPNKTAQYARGYADGLCAIYDSIEDKDRYK
jgi:cob(I)alamin adenosyltransferase